MKPSLTFADTDVAAALPALSYAVCQSPEMPAYYELALEDEQGDRAHWVVPMPLKQLAKRPVLLWLLSATPMLSSLACVEAGTMQLAATRAGTAATLHSELAQGVLRLNFNGQLLRGYYRLSCLPTGCGQLWQLTPIGQV